MKTRLIPFMLVLVLGATGGLNPARADGGPTITGSTWTTSSDGEANADYDPQSMTIHASSSTSRDNQGLVSSPMSKHISQSISSLAWEQQAGIVEGSRYVATVKVNTPNAGPDVPTATASDLDGSSLNPVFGGPSAESDILLDIEVSTPSITTSTWRHLACTDTGFVHETTCNAPAEITYSNSDTPVYTRSGLDATPFVRVTVSLQSTSQLDDPRGIRAGSSSALTIDSITLKQV